MAYRLMLVDDEADIREGMKRIIDWAAYDFELVGEADNGMDGLQLAEQMRPDLVITDIRMHFMDGLEMIEKMRAFLPMTQFVVLSGYDEFEYARKSIQMRIVDYVLKPISALEFEEVLARAKETLDQEHQKRRSIDSLNEYLSASLPMLKDQLLCSLMSGGMDDGQAEHAARRYGMRIDAHNYVGAVLGVTRLDADSPRDMALSGDAELLRLAIGNIVREVLEERVRCYVFNYNGQVAVLAMLDAGQSVNLLLELMDTACRVVSDYLGVSCAAGVGEPCGRLSELAQSARQALNALDHWALMGESNVIYIADLRPHSTRRLFVDERTLNQLTNAIKVKQQSEIHAQIHALVERVRGTPISFKEYQLYMLEALLGVIRTAHEMDADPDVLEGAYDHLLEDFMKARGLDQMERMFSELCVRISSSISVKRIESGQRIVQQAVQLLNDQYGEESLTIERIADQLHISPSYFRALFKRETGRTFHQHLTDLRMNRAMELLRGTDLKTAQISHQIGLGEPSYFSYSFKKYFGVSPSQVRKDAGKR